MGRRRRAGPGVREFIPLWPRARVPEGGWSRVAGVAPGLMQDLLAAPSDLRLAVRGPLQEGREGRDLAKELPDLYEAWFLFFTQSRDSASARYQLTQKSLDERL